MTVFHNCYPVWCDDDGGWHEGAGYWCSYIARFTWWADVMRSATGIDAYDHPYFSKIGDYAIYLMPPGKTDGGLGDCNGGRKSSSNAPLMAVLAAQAGNPYWQDYAQRCGGGRPESSYIEMSRGTLPAVESKSLAKLPGSKCFHGTGQAYLNTCLTDSNDNVQIVFKSSPFGTQSHGYEANNTFLLWAYGKQLLIRSGRRDHYGSEHHRNWMWSTRSVNNITVDGIGQLHRSPIPKGEITRFSTTPSLDLVEGEAADSYHCEKSDELPDGRPLTRYTRTILFAKPALIVVIDRLVAARPSTFEYWLHSTEAFDVVDSQNVNLKVDNVVCPIRFLAPTDLEFTQTDKCDPPPRERVKLRQFHLTGRTPKKQTDATFVTIYRPQRASEATELSSTLQASEGGGYHLTAQLKDGDRLEAVIPPADSDEKVTANVIENE